MLWSILFPFSFLIALEQVHLLSYFPSKAYKTISACHGTEVKQQEVVKCIYSVLMVYVARQVDSKLNVESVHTKRISRGYRKKKLFLEIVLNFSCCYYSILQIYYIYCKINNT